MLRSVEEAIVVAYRKALDGVLEKFLKLPDEEKVISFIEFVFKKQDLLKLSFLGNQIIISMITQGVGYGNGSFELCSINSENLFDIDVIFSTIVEKLKNFELKDYNNSHIIRFIDQFCTFMGDTKSK